MTGRVWDDAENLARTFAPGDVVRVWGQVTSFKGQLQIKIDGLERLDPREADPGRFLPSAPRPGEEYLAELRLIAAALGSPIRDLCLAILDDPELARLLSRAPAAKHMHHAYVGGLAEHTLSVANLALRAAEHYPFLNRDLLVCGALLHDLGKTRELAFSPMPDYTDAGRLLGHLVMGVEMIRAHLPADFPPGLAEEVIHLVLSHHGTAEFGAVKPPQTLEAVALNLIDDLDAKMAAVRTLLDQEAPQPGDWTGYHRLFERYFFRGGAPAEAPGAEVASGRPPRPKSERAARSGQPRPKPTDEDDPGLFG